MSELTPTDPYAAQLADQVLEAGQVIRARERAIREKLANDAELARERDCRPEVQLAGEVEKLQQRLFWLHEHPRLSRVIGKTAIGIEHADNSYKPYPDTLKTKPLTDGEISLLRGEHLLFSGLVFWSFYTVPRFRGRQIKINGQTVKLPDRSDHELHIEQQVRDETTGAKRSRRLYSLTPYESTTGPRVEVWSPDRDEFRNYAGQRIQQAIERYSRVNPWAKDHSYEERGRRIRFPYTPSMIGNEHNRQADRLNRELVPHLIPGTSWEYPDEYFLEPLGLVKEMNLLLGTKNK